MKVLHLYGPYPLRTNTFLCIGENGNAVVIDPAAAAQDAAAKDHVFHLDGRIMCAM